MRAWQAGQAMTRSRAASRSRRAAGRLRLGGKAGRGLTGGVEERIAPDEGDQGEMAVQARPGPSLVVAEAELLFAILMEALHGPALVCEAELVIEGVGIQVPGEVVLRLAVLTGQWTLANEPAERAGGVAVGTVDAQTAGLALAPLLLRVEDGDRGPLLIRDGRGQRLRGVQRCDLAGMRSRTRATTTRCLRARSSGCLGDLSGQPDAERLGDLDDVRLLPRLQPGQEGRHVAVPRIRRDHAMRHPGSVGAVDQ